MNTHSEFLAQGCIALVSYVPGPLGPAVDRLRSHLSPDGNTKAHITLLPPRPLFVSVDVASRIILETLQCAAPFEVEISGLRCFPTNVLYLGIGEGSIPLHQLHDSLNSGPLAHTETFDYLPHLTLSSPLPSHHHVERATRLVETAWQEVFATPRFRLDEAALLWRSPESHSGTWSRLWTQRLGIAANVAIAAPSL